MFRQCVFDVCDSLFVKDVRDRIGYFSTFAVHCRRNNGQFWKKRYREFFNRGIPAFHTLAAMHVRRRLVSIEPYGAFGRIGDARGIINDDIGEWRFVETLAYRAMAKNPEYRLSQEIKSNITARASAIILSHQYSSESPVRLTSSPAARYSALLECVNLCTLVRRTVMVQLEHIVRWINCPRSPTIFSSNSCHTYL